MDYLLQQGMNREMGLRLIDSFIKHLSANKTGLEPYPISLRGNWIQFLNSYCKDDEKGQIGASSGMFRESEIHTVLAMIK